MLWLFLGLVCFATALPRGQDSYRMPEARENVLVSHLNTSQPVWSRPFDMPTGAAGVVSHDQLALGGGLVAFASRGHMCAFSVVSGRQLWCGNAGGSPAYTRGVIAYTADEFEGVRAVDAQTGNLEWTAPSALTVWRVRNDFLLVDRAQAGGPSRVVSERRPDGRLLWRSQIQGYNLRTIYVVPGFALLSWGSGGATINNDWSVFRTGAHGAYQSMLRGAFDVLDIHPPLVIYRTEPNEDVQEHFVTVDLAIANLNTGAVQRKYHFEPDYDTNRVLLSSTNEFAGQGEPLVRVDGEAVYISVLGAKLYRYLLNRPPSQRPLLVADHSRLLGGPFKGWLYVSRSSGVWALRQSANDIRSRLIIPGSQARDVRIVGDTAFFSLSDGRLIGVDANSGVQTFRALPCTSGFESGVMKSDRVILVLCTGGSRPHVVAFKA